MHTATITENILRRDRQVVIGGLVAIVLLSWAYMVYMAWDMVNMMGMEIGMEMGMEMAMPNMQSWRFVNVFLLFVMWTVMQIAMMTPSAAPMVLTYSKISRRQKGADRPIVATTVFYLGYILVWTLFSAVAAIAQTALHNATLLSPMMETTSPILGGVILVAAGIFQFTPYKTVCLSHCRTPIGFFMTEWRDGTKGALQMGIKHGAFCVGCCWLLMALLFVGGVMNLLWIGIIAAYVLAEKVLPGGHRVSWGIGVVMLAWGGWMIVAALV